MTAVAPCRADVVAALRVVGQEDPGKPTTIKASKTARVLLDTIPIAALIGVMPSLWEQEEKKRRRDAARPRYVVLSIATLLLAIPTLHLCGVGPRWFGTLTPLMSGINVLGLVLRAFGHLTPVQKGILRTLHLRPHLALVPLMVNTLDAVKLTGSPVTQSEHHALLTRFLPSWCESEAEDFTLRQRRTLLLALREMVGKKSFFFRPVGQPPTALPLPDADFACCVIAALRRCRIAPSDKRPRTYACRTLAGIEAPCVEDDPRHEVRIVAQEYAALLHRGK